MLRILNRLWICVNYFIVSKKKKKSFITLWNKPNPDENLLSRLNILWGVHPYFNKLLILEVGSWGHNCFWLPLHLLL